jgi:predicted AAA+ superfamily ATPase
MISVSEIAQIVKSQENDMRGRLARGFIPRELKLDKKDVKFDVASIITGPRRSGKSTFAFAFLQNQDFGYINFDDERLSEITLRELDKVLEAIYYLKGNVKFLLFDEIQTIKGWELFIARLVVSKKVILTGSNSSLLSKELATHLTGRHKEYELLPFSFREFLEYKKVHLNSNGVYTTEEKAQIIKLLEEYLKNGGFPIVLDGDPNMVLGLYRDVVERDIIQRYKIRQSAKFKQFVKYLISNSSSEISYNKLKNIFGIGSSHTVQNWINFIENSYLTIVVDRFSFKLKESILAPKKVYTVDNGFITQVTGSNEISRLIENTVLVELLRRKSYFDKSIEINYWKNELQAEVDFLLRKGKSVTILIQVSYINDKMEIKEREIKNLLSASKELHCSNLLIITWDYEAEEKINGKKIKFIPLWKWLLTLN